MEINKGHTHILERIKETDVSGNIRTDGAVEGHFNTAPEIGKGFKFYGKGIDFGTRMIYTSDLVSINSAQSDEPIYFTTMSGSEYKLSVIKDE